MAGSGGYGGGPYGDGAYGGSSESSSGGGIGVPIYTGFASPLYPVPAGVPLGRIKITKFSGEPVTGLLAPSAGQVFFSASLIEQIGGNEFDIESVVVTINASDIYSPEIRESKKQFTWGPNSTSVTNDSDYATQPSYYQAMGAMVDETDLVALANDLRTQYEAHRASAVFHSIADATNVISAAVAADLSSATTLLNDIKAKFDAHRTEVGVHPSDDVINEIVSSDADGNPASAATLANELKLKYNAHRTSPGVHASDDGVNIVTASDPSVIIKVM
jgi:hypothetical protein